MDRPRREIIVPAKYRTPEAPRKEPKSNQENNLKNQ